MGAHSKHLSPVEEVLVALARMGVELTDTDRNLISTVAGIGEEPLADLLRLVERVWVARPAPEPRELPDALAWRRRVEEMRGVASTGADGGQLADEDAVVALRGAVTPSGCVVCGVPEYAHRQPHGGAEVYDERAGWHTYQAPSDEQGRSRMQARRQKRGSR